jgi:hypothetical protein
MGALVEWAQAAATLRRKKIDENCGKWGDSVLGRSRFVSECRRGHGQIDSSEEESRSNYGGMTTRSASTPLAPNPEGLRARRRAPVQVSNLPRDGCVPTSRHRVDPSSPWRPASPGPGSADPGLRTSFQTDSRPLGMTPREQNLAPWFNNGDSNRFSADIETHKFYFAHRPASFARGSVLLTQRNPRIGDPSWPFHVD